MHAEAMLLVDNDQPEPLEFDAGLEQRMRADGDRRLSRGDQYQGGRSFGGSVLAGQQNRRQPRRARQRLDRREMLAGEQLSGRHQRGLAAGLGDLRHREQRHPGLARADIALQQPQHACAAG